jgi:hypothetical protein
MLLLLLSDQGQIWYSGQSTSKQPVLDMVANMLKKKVTLQSRKFAAGGKINVKFAIHM